MCAEWRLTAAGDVTAGTDDVRAGTRDVIAGTCGDTLMAALSMCVLALDRRATGQR